ncbi:Galactose-proton symporter [Galdieria sulphuraria]|nr:Galactose-proton symporter [Galdieria sulphuraria]
MALRNDFISTEKVNLNDDAVISETNTEINDKDCIEENEKDEGVTNLLRFFLFVTCWGSTMMGMDLGLTGGAALYVEPALHISSNEWSWIASGAGWGCVIGSILATPLSFIVGRKPVLITSSLLYMAGVVVAASSFSWGQLLAGRLIMGVGIGTEAMTIPMYISEVEVASWRPS